MAHERMINSMTEIFELAGFPVESCNLLASTSFFYRIAVDSIAFYISLHQHLSFAATVSGFPTVSMELEHHVTKLKSIRATQPSRLMALIYLYCYLRDNNAKGWVSLAIHEKKMAVLYARMAADPESNPMCGHCSSRVHAGGKTRCPWKALTRAKAKEAATSGAPTPEDETGTPGP